MRGERSLGPKIDAHAREKVDASPFVTFVRGTMAEAISTWALDRADWFMWDREAEGARQRTKTARPNGEPPAHVLVREAEDLFDLEPSPERHAATGQAIHFGIGILPAITYVFLRRKLPGRGIARGLMFGGGMFLVQDEIMNTVSDLATKPRAYPWQAHARGLVAHLIYGVATELTMNAMERHGGRLAGDYARKPTGDADSVRG